MYGPPGTGKTHLIASYVANIGTLANESVFLIAPTNVAVLNIALKFLAIGLQVEWKIIVSNEFLKDWCVLNTLIIIF